MMFKSVIVVMRKHEIRQSEKVIGKKGNKAFEVYHLAMLPEIVIL